LKKPKHLRPPQDFRVTSLEWELDIERRHRDAGFAPVTDEVIRRRFSQFAEFLAANEMIADPDSCRSELLTELRNAHLTNEGFYFVQQFHGRWLDRSHKDRGAEAERRILEKWYRKFEEEFEVPVS
jgi:hypothetical protein